MMMGLGMFGIVGMLAMLLFWGVLIFLAVWFVKVIFSGNSRGNSSFSQKREGSEAQEILAQRYARGEITREQYEIMKQDLR